MAKGLAINQSNMLSSSTLGACSMEGADVGLIDGADWEGLNRGHKKHQKKLFGL